MLSNESNQTYSETRFKTQDSEPQMKKNVLRPESPIIYIGF